jgi:hypothetical protein
VAHLVFGETQSSVHEEIADEIELMWWWLYVHVERYWTVRSSDEMRWSQFSCRVSCLAELEGKFAQRIQENSTLVASRLLLFFLCVSSDMWYGNESRGNKKGTLNFCVFYFVWTDSGSSSFFYFILTFPFLFLCLADVKKWDVNGTNCNDVLCLIKRPFLIVLICV